MDKYSPFYNDPNYEPDITKLSNQALEERLIFLEILRSDLEININTLINLNKYTKTYQQEWERRRNEANHNNN